MFGNFQTSKVICLDAKSNGGLEVLAVLADCRNEVPSDKLIQTPAIATCINTHLSSHSLCSTLFFSCVRTHTHTHTHTHTFSHLHTHTHRDTFMLPNTHRDTFMLTNIHTHLYV